MATASRPPVLPLGSSPRSLLPLAIQSYTPPRPSSPSPHSKAERSLLSLLERERKVHTEPPSSQSSPTPTPAASPQRRLLAKTDSVEVVCDLGSLVERSIALQTPKSPRRRRSSSCNNTTLTPESRHRPRFSTSPSITVVSATTSTDSSRTADLPAPRATTIRMAHLGLHTSLGSSPPVSCWLGASVRNCRNATPSEGRVNNAKASASTSLLTSPYSSPMSVHASSTPRRPRMAPRRHTGSPPTLRADMGWPPLPPPSYALHVAAPKAGSAHVGRAFTHVGKGHSPALADAYTPFNSVRRNAPAVTKGRTRAARSVSPDPQAAASVHMACSLPATPPRAPPPSPEALGQPLPRGITALTARAVELSCSPPQPLDGMGSSAPCSSAAGVLLAAPPILQGAFDVERASRRLRATTGRVCFDDVALPPPEDADDEAGPEDRESRSKRPRMRRRWSLW